MELYRKISGVDALDIERLIRRVKARDRVGDHASVEVGLATATSNVSTHAEILMADIRKEEVCNKLQNPQERAWTAFQCDVTSQRRMVMCVVCCRMITN